MANLELPISIKMVNPIPLDAWRGPYATIAAANAAVSSGVRYKTRQVDIVPTDGSEPYVAWYKDGILDSNLVQMTSADAGLDFGNWTAATNKSAQILSEDITIRYKADFNADEDKAITYVQGQFTLLANTATTNLQLAQIPAQVAPVSNLKYFMVVAGVPVNLVVQSDGVIRLQTVDGTTNLPTGASNTYTAFFLYNPIKEQDRLPINTVLLTSFDEFGYDTNIRFATTEYGAGKAFNGVYEQVKLGIDPPVKADFLHMLDNDASLLPDLNETVMWINWFSPGMYNPATVRPYIQETVKESIAVNEWISGGYNTSTAITIPERLKGSGSMDDQAFVNGAKALQARGIKVGIVPVISTLDVNAGAGQGYLNWRGYIIWDSFSAYQTWVAEYITFVKYYVNLCHANAIDLSLVYVGSEFQCMLTADYTGSPAFGSLQGGWSSANQAIALQVKADFITTLANLATYVKGLFPQAVCTYASNWTEYNVLDDLWKNPAIDAIGIDWYYPLTTTHTNNIDELTAGVWSGEYADYYLTGAVDSEYYVSTSSKQGKALLTHVPITDTSYLAGLKRVREYIAHLQTAYGVDKPVIATELGVASSEGSSVLPNVFPELIYQSGSDTTGNLVLPDGHNMKSFFNTLSQYSMQIKDVKGPYGWTGEYDEQHQFNALKAIITQLRANNINRQVIYTLDARPVDTFGATIYNTETNQNEIYTGDTPIIPLNHSINGKLAGGNPNGDLITRVTPNDSLTQPNPESTASRTIGSFVNADVLDEEWKETGIAGFNVCTDDGTYLNADNAATATSGRFAYFGTMGTRTPTIQRVRARCAFTAKGSGTMEIVLYSASDMTQVQARRTFTLTTDWKDYNWTLPNLYPQLEMVIAILVSGGNTTPGTKVAFKKNFGLILKQANLNGNFVRLRADNTNLKGNSETGWYGWSDTYNQARKKYIQSSAYSKFQIDTDATELAIEYCRDFYDAPTKQLIPAITIQNGFYLASNGAITSGNGAVGTSVVLNDAVGTAYTISGLRATTPEAVWCDANLNPVGSKFTLSVSGHSDIKDTSFTNIPYYTITKPSASAVRLAILIQRITNPANYKDPVNDSYKVYQYILMEKGATGDPSPDYDTVPSDWKGYIGPVNSHVSGLAVFVNNVPFQYLQLEGNDTAKQVQFVQVTGLPAGTKTVEVVHNGRGTYLPASPNVRRAGTFMRAVYLPDTATYTVNTTTVNGICFYHDSIMSGFNLSTFPQYNVWNQRMARDPAYGYVGDIYSEGYAGRIMHTDTATPEGLEALAQKLASFGVDKYWMQIGVNDYGFTTPIAKFTTEYPALMDRLHELRPNSKFYIQTIGPEYYDGPNSESFSPDDPDVPTGPPESAFTQVQKDYANNRSWCELVDFKGLFPVNTTNSPDGIHPSDTGNILYANGIRDKSTLLIDHPKTITILPTDIANFQSNTVYSQQLTSQGGTFPYVYTLTTGSLPTGITLSSTGLLSGTPTVDGTYTYTIKSTDSTGIFTTRAFTSLVTDTQSGIPEGSRSLGYRTMVNPDLYSEEWKFPLANTSYNSSYVTVTDDGTWINPNQNASGNAGRYVFFKTMGSKATDPPPYIPGNITFEARGTGTIEIVLFAVYQSGIQARKTFVLTADFQVFTWDISLYPTLEFFVGVFVNGMNTSGNAKVQFKKNFALHLDNFPDILPKSNYRRYRADETTLVGNLETKWWGYCADFSGAQQNKYLQASAYSFLRFNTDATNIVIEYVRDMYDNTTYPPNTISGLTVFINNTTNIYVDCTAYEATAYSYNLNVVQVPVTLPAGTKSVEVVSCGRSKYSNVDPTVTYAIGGNYIRAVYVPEANTFSPGLRAHAESILTIVDSISSGYILTTNAPRYSWQNQIHRDTQYNYPGDIFTDGFAGMYIWQMVGQPAWMEAYAQKIATTPAKKLFIQAGVNDFFTQSSTSSFESYYGAFLDRLHTLRPDMKIFIATMLSYSNETINGPSNQTIVVWRQSVRNVASTRSWITVVEFGNLFDGTSTANLPDGLHPSTIAQNLMAARFNSSSITTIEVLGFTPLTIPTITKGIPISQTFTTVSAKGSPVTYSISSGALPAGITLSSGGVLSGTATTLGSYNFTIQVSDTLTTFAKAYTGTVTNPVIAITPSTFNATVRGTSVSQALAASGGISPYSYAVTSGALPTGLSLASGTISGTVSAVGNYTFSITATDNNGNTTAQAFTWNVVAPNVVISPNTLTTKRQNVASSDQFSATGGVGTYTYTVDSGTLPTGLTLSSAGLLAGTPTTLGNYSFVIKATDTNGNTGTLSFVNVNVDYASPFVLTGSAVVTGGNIMVTVSSRFAVGQTTYIYVQPFAYTTYEQYISGAQFTFNPGDTTKTINAGGWSFTAGQATKLILKFSSQSPGTDANGTAFTYTSRVEYPVDAQGNVSTTASLVQ